MNYPLYPVRSFTYRNEQVSAGKVQRVSVHNPKNLNRKRICARTYVYAGACVGGRQGRGSTLMNLYDHTS
jgi:hypothetical protein